SGHVSYTYEGPCARVLGLLWASLGHWNEAETHLRHGLDLVRRAGLGAWEALMNGELSEVLAHAGKMSESERTREQALKCAETLSYTGLLKRMKPASPVASLGQPSSRSFQLVRAGEGWEIQFGEKRLRAKDSRGMELVSRLVSRPGEEIHVLA